MSEHVYRITEVVGSSSESVQQAIRNGVERASRTLRMVEWFEVTEIRGRVDAGQVEQFQVGMKIGFRLDDRATGSRSYRPSTAAARKAKVSLRPVPSDGTVGLVAGLPATSKGSSARSWTRAR